MSYWLVKSDPEAYSFHDLVRDKKTEWTGVRNYAARIHLNGMKKGDEVLVYHSGKDKAVVGFSSVTKSAFPDPTTDEAGWVAVELKAGAAFKNPVKLDVMKKEKKLVNIGLIKIGRLSVMPLTEEEFNTICTLGL